ncbi:MAG: hypothetical protein KF687_07885 [Cyclobacteriaceae bacterium]|nr:hypothetical protein [Cyclobacteriaceae bacterium]
MKNLFLLLLSVGVSHALAQVQVRGGFVQDTIRIGDPVSYYLTAQYPSHFTLLFPDSVYSFDPFEFQRKKYQPTITLQGISYDSVVYELVTFEVDDIQYLTLPVYLVNQRDCTQYVPLRDSIVLATLIKEPISDTVSLPDLPLLTNTAYQRVSLLLNYPILLITIGVLLVATLVTWIAFGKRIKRYLQIKKLKKNHARFLTDFGLRMRSIQQQFNASQTEETLSTWKKYLEKLEGKPFTKLTTRETIALEQDEQLGKSLQELDRAIYGSSANIIDALTNLQQVAETRFTRKLEGLNHG